MTKANRSAQSPATRETSQEAHAARLTASYAWAIWIVGLLPSSPWSREVGRLRSLLGVDTPTAVGLCVEIGDFERFAPAEQVMS
jgi:hypothetical protein